MPLSAREFYLALRSDAGGHRAGTTKCFGSRRDLHLQRSQPPPQWLPFRGVTTP